MWFNIEVKQLDAGVITTVIHFAHLVLQRSRKNIEINLTAMIQLTKKLSIVALTLNAPSSASCCLRSEDFFNIKHIEPDILRLLFISEIRVGKCWLESTEGRQIHDQKIRSLIPLEKMIFISFVNVCRRYLLEFTDL